MTSPTHPSQPWRPVAGMVDLHSHLIPGVDDGAEDLAMAVEAVARLARAGVSRVVCTPHCTASLTERPDDLAVRLAEFDVAYALLLDALPPGSPEVLRGVELKLDTPHPNVSDPRLRLGGSSAVLVEFSLQMLPPNTTFPLRKLRDEGWQPVLAHPERYREVQRDLSIARSWRDAGAVLQVNAGSLVGQYGRGAEAAAWDLLAEGTAHCLSGDYHARSEPTWAAAMPLVLEAGGDIERLAHGVATELLAGVGRSGADEHR